MTGERIQTYHFSSQITQGESVIQEILSEQTELSAAVENLQKRMIEDALRKCGGNQTQAARILGIHQPNLSPETWIPYHLKDAAPVSIGIYNASGQLIRTLDLGHKDAGVYISWSKAAYWDGKNEASEEVASGLYFYSITAGDFSNMRKMIVTK